MERLGMPVSDDTILRQLKRDATVAHCNSEVRVVGIDDWSWRRATSYGTIVVDCVFHKVRDKDFSKSRTAISESPGQ